MRPENVWDYPRPPRAEPVAERLRIVFAGMLVAETSGGDPGARDLAPAGLLPAARGLHLPRHHPPSGRASASGRAWRAISRWLRAAARRWIAPGPIPIPLLAFAAIRDHVAVYPAAMDACFVGDEQVQPQPGGFYGGWVTSNLTGPFKGGPGTMGW